MLPGRDGRLLLLKSSLSKFLVLMTPLLTWLEFPLYVAPPCFCCSLLWSPHPSVLFYLKKYENKQIPYPFHRDFSLFLFSLTSAILFLKLTCSCTITYLLMHNSFTFSPFFPFLFLQPTTANTPFFPDCQLFFAIVIAVFVFAYIEQCSF